MTENYSKTKEYTVSIFKIYTFSLFLLIPIIILFVLPYVLIWNNSLSNLIRLIFSKIKFNWDNVFAYLYLFRQIFLWSLVLLAGAVLHELLHAVFWVFYNRKGIRSIQFGFSKSDFSPYVHCTEPLPAWLYRLGSLMPGIILGIIPAIIAIFTGSIGFLVFGVFFTWAASGDFLIIWQTRKINRKTLLLDHPEKVGCIIVNREY